MHNYGEKINETDKYEFYLDQKHSQNTVNIIENSGAKIVNNNEDEEILEEIIIENENKFKVGKK